MDRIDHALVHGVHVTYLEPDAVRVLELFEGVALRLVHVLVAHLLQQDRL